MSFVLTRPQTPSLFRPVLGRSQTAPAETAHLPLAHPEAVTALPPAAAFLPHESQTLGTTGGTNAAADALLAKRAADGDVRAFQQLVERYQKPMAALVSRMVSTSGNTHAASSDVDDIVQELFIRAWKGLPRFRHDAQFSTWLYRIAVNTTIKHRAKHKTEAALSVSADNFAGGFDALPMASDALPPGGGDPFWTASKRERDNALRQAVAQLPEKQRTVVVLHYFEGHSCEEISQIVGCSLGTVWSRLHYACKRLKGVMEPGEGLA